MIDPCCIFKAPFIAYGNLLGNALLSDIILCLKSFIIHNEKLLSYPKWIHSFNYSPCKWLDSILTNVYGVWQFFSSYFAPIWLISCITLCMWEAEIISVGRREMKTCMFQLWKHLKHNITMVQVPKIIPVRLEKDNHERPGRADETHSLTAALTWFYDRLALPKDMEAGEGRRTQYLPN